MTDDTIAERLRGARTEAEIGSRELDKIAGLSPGHTAMIEGRKRSSVDAHTAAKLARALGVSIDWLITGEGVRPTAKQLKAAAKRGRSSAA